MKPTFSFGRNWLSLAKHLTDDAVRRAEAEKHEWLGESDVRGKRVLDAGCGSGLHSWNFHSMGAAEVVSFDYDPASVEASQLLHQRAGSPANWRIVPQSASILDAGFLATLTPADVVYSWGVLHHTGEMWQAMENIVSLVAPGGLLWISLYAKGDKYAEHLALKESFNRAPLPVQFVRAVGLTAHTILENHGRRGLLRLQMGRERGMNYWHDAWDWLGGLPYEVASPEEVREFCSKRGFELVKESIIPAPADGGCHVYLLRRSS